MLHPRNRGRTPLLVVGLVLALSAGAGAFTLILSPLPTFTGVLLQPDETFQHIFAGLKETGYSIRSLDGSLLTLNNGVSSFDPDDGWEPGTRVQDGFILLDGTLSLTVNALKEGTRRARTRNTFRLDLRRDALRPASIRDTLLRRGMLRDVRDPVERRARALARARAVELRDARVMRRVVRDDGARWVRAVRVLGTPDRIRFRDRTAPTGVLGHFGYARSTKAAPEGAPVGDFYVWAVVDRNSKYAIGLTVDRDNDGVPNSSDNCIGTPNPNQSNADGDPFGDACDDDDDNDDVIDGSDNCPLSANAGQEDFDGDSAGDACDFDDDNDNVTDGTDQCLATASGSTVDGTGCSIADQCPCDSDWRNHGAYVKCVARTSDLFLQAGLITSTQKDAIVSAGAKSSCGS